MIVVCAVENQFGLVRACTPVELELEGFPGKRGALGLSEVFLISKFEHEFDPSWACDVAPVIRVRNCFGVLKIEGCV